MRVIINQNVLELTLGDITDARVDAIAAEKLAAIRARGTYRRMRRLDGAQGPRMRVDGRDVVAVADAIVSILGDPDRARSMGEAGRRFARRDLRWPSRAGQLRQILQSLPDATD